MRRIESPGAAVVFYAGTLLSLPLARGTYLVTPLSAATDRRRRAKNELVDRGNGSGHDKVL